MTSEPDAARWPHLADRADILRWADRIESRSEFPRLVRDLVKRTNDQVVELRMRAAEGTGLPGFDGFSKAAKATPFVPSGDAVWELGTGSDPKAKAEEDYKKRTEKPKPHDPSETTFVFVTPREWRDKDDWAAAKRAEGVWADVRVFDVDDLEQAMEDAHPVHVRFSELIGKPAVGVQTVEDWWLRFSELTSPALSPELVLAGRADAASELIRILDGTTRLTLISAASVDDVLAFVVASILSTPEDNRLDLLSRSLIVRDALTLRRLDSAEGLLILLPFDVGLHRDAQLVRGHHVLLLAADGRDADLKVPGIDHGAFRQLLEHLGEPPERAKELARAGARSIVAFQRKAMGARGATPAWASTVSAKTARRIWLAGRWNERKSGDADAVATLVEAGYGQAREELLSLTEGPDPLFTIVGSTWAVISTEDAWETFGRALQAPDLAAFESLIQTVLAAVDPSLDLEPSERWMAAVYGKTPVHSGDLRAGIADSLALLAAKGDSPSAGSTETIRSWVHGTLWRLFERFNGDETGHLWASASDVLPLLAEAAPDVFLQAVQKGLEGQQPLTQAMFTDQESGLTVNSPHTGLLWALEGVAWSAEHFGLAVDVLAQLADVDPGGTLSNRPAGSLADIFRPWLPQTAATPASRLDAIDGLRERHPDVAWELMLSALPETHMVGGYTHSPRYRDWKPDDEGVTRQEYAEVVSSIAQRLIADASGRADRLTKLIDRLPDLPPDEFQLAVAAIKKCGTGGSEGTPTELWEPLHALVQRHRRFSHTKWAMADPILDGLDELLEELRPKDVVQTSAWLFQEHMPDIDGVYSEEFDAKSYREAVDEARQDAVRAVVADGGLESLKRLIQTVEHPYFVGWSSGQAAPDEAEALLLPELDGDDPKLSAAAQGWARERARSQDWTWVQSTFESLKGRPLAAARVLLASDQPDKAWETAASTPDVEAAYWAEFNPYGHGADFGHVNEAVEKLLQHDRPATAITMLSTYSRTAEGFGSDLVLRVLEAFREMPADHGDTARVDSHDLGELLDYLRGQSADEERLASLEWSLRPALRFDARSPTLERRLASDPAFFVEVLSLCYKPKNGGEDQAADEHVAGNAYRLLNDWRIVPGYQDQKPGIDQEALDKWVDEARKLLTTADRSEIGDVFIGHILAHAPEDPDDGLWPARAVRNVIERVASSTLEKGFQVEIYNKRGVTSRALDEGGERERSRADKYSALAEGLKDSWPRTARALRAVSSSYQVDARRNDEQAQRFREGLD